MQHSASPHDDLARVPRARTGEGSYRKDGCRVASASLVCAMPLPSGLANTRCLVCRIGSCHTGLAIESLPIAADRPVPICSNSVPVFLIVRAYNRTSGRRIDSSARETSPIRTCRKGGQFHDLSAINKPFTVLRITLRSLYCLS